MKAEIELDFTKVDPETLDPQQVKSFGDDLQQWILEYFDHPELVISNFKIED